MPEIPDLTVAFFYQDEWEAQRFKDNVPPDVTVVALPRGSAPDEVDAASRDADMIVGGGRVRELDAARTYSRLKLVQTLSAGIN
ncbi:MAG: hypothetical protein IIB28_08065 [Chloroflexi bacterium]|nr:hypothetical protein [Chloroflexota bacterium]